MTTTPLTIEQRLARLEAAVFPFILAVVLMLLAAMLLSGCSPIYWRCSECNASFKQKWNQQGLPGQTSRVCKFCHRGTIYQCTAEESGWDESREGE